MHFFVRYQYPVRRYNATATSQRGIAIVVRKNNGIPKTAMPIIASRAIVHKQMLWQICQDPKILEMPEALLTVLTIFVLIFCFPVV